MELGPEDVSLFLISEGGMYRLQCSWDLKMCPYFRGWYVQASMVYMRNEGHPHLNSYDMYMYGSRTQV